MHEFELYSQFADYGAARKKGQAKLELRTVPKVFLEGNRTPVGRAVFKTVEGRRTSLVGSTPTPFRQIRPTDHWVDAG